MRKLDVDLEIPFVENTGRRCVPACTAMILEYCIPGHPYSSKAIEDLSGFREGRSTWAAQHLLSLNDLGLDVGWIQDEDLPAFAANPQQYMQQQIPNMDEYKRFAESNDIALEASRIDEYLGKGLPFEQRQATQSDIINRMLGGWIIRLEVNGKALANQEGSAAHAVIVSGFNDNVVRLENPDGVYGSKPKQTISWQDLHNAWTDPTMQYYRR